MLTKLSNLYAKFHLVQARGLARATLRVLLCAVSLTPVSARCQDAGTSHPELVWQFGHKRSIREAVFNSDRQVVISVDFGGEVKQWSTQTGALLRTWESGYGAGATVALSSNGALLATAHPRAYSKQPSEVRVWDVQSETLLCTFVSQNRQANTWRLAFSPDEKFLALGTTSWESDGEVTVWNLKSREMMWTAKTGPTDPNCSQTALKFSNDNSVLAFGHSQATIWDSYTKGQSNVRLSSKEEGVIGLWNVQGGKSLPTLHGLDNLGFDFRLAPDGKTLVAINSKSMSELPFDQKYQIEVRQCDTQTGRGLRSLSWPAPAFFYGGRLQNMERAAIGVSSNAQTVARWNAGKIELWNLADGKLRRVLTGFNLAGFNAKANAVSLRFFHGDQILWVEQSIGAQSTPAGKRDTAREVFQLRDATSGRALTAWIKADLSGTPWFVGASSYPPAFSADGKMFVTQNRNRGLDLRNTSDGATDSPAVEPIALPELRALAFAPRGNKLALATEHEALLWDVAREKMTVLIAPDAKQLPDPKVLPNTISSLAFSPQGDLLAVGGGQDSDANPQSLVALYNVQTASLVHRLPQQKQFVTALTFLPDNQHLAVATGQSDDNINKGNVTLWDVRTGKLAHNLVEKSQAVSALGVGGDATEAVLAVGYLNGASEAWHIPNDLSQAALGKSAPPRKRLAPDSYYAYSLKAIAVSPDGKTIASANAFDVQIWDSLSGAHLHELSGHFYEPFSIAFSPDGTLIQSAGLDGATRLWNARTGEGTQLYLGPAASRAAAFSPHGEVIASSTVEGTIFFRGTHTGVLKATLQLLGRRQDLSQPYYHVETPGFNGQWIAWMPDGFYTGSPGCEKYIRWRVGDNVFPAAKYSKQFHRPDKVRQALQNRS